MIEINVLGKEKLKKIPTLPLSLIRDDGLIIETNKVEGLVSTLIGKDFLKTDNEDERWYKRLFRANIECIKARNDKIDTEIFDRRKGVINNNFVIAPKEETYKLKNNTSTIKIRVDNDKLFILSLLKIRAFSLLERKNSFIFKPNKDISNEESLCVFRSKESKSEYIDLYLEYDIDKLIDKFDNK